MHQALPFLLAALTLTGCRKHSATETIEAKDHDLSIARDGKTLVTIRPYGNGTEVKVHNANGEWIQVHSGSPDGQYSSIYIQRNKADGTPVFIEVQSDGRSINRSEHPLGSLPGDEGYHAPTKTEQGVPPNDR